MKLHVLALMATTLAVSAPAFAQPGRNDDRGYDRRDRDDRGLDRDRDRGPRWERGDRLPPEFRGKRYEFADWRRERLRPPPRGYRWMRIDADYVLVGKGWLIDTVVPIYAPPPPPPRPVYVPRPPAPPTMDRDAAWRARYSRTYSMADDPTYRQCKDKVDPAGVAIGAIIGGLFGNAVGGRNSGGATVAGVVAGGALGAALTHKLDCNDRSYVYRTQMEGFNAGRAGATYEWRNPENNHRGNFKVIDYYKDEDNFRYSVYSQEVFIDGRPEEVNGRACQQPNGTWVIID